MDNTKNPRNTRQEPVDRLTPLDPFSTAPLTAEAAPKKGFGQVVANIGAWFSQNGGGLFDTVGKARAALGKNRGGGGGSEAGGSDEGARSGAPAGPAPGTILGLPTLAFAGLGLLVVTVVVFLVLKKTAKPA